MNMMLMEEKKDMCKVDKKAMLVLEVMDWIERFV